MGGSGLLRDERNKFQNGTGSIMGNENSVFCAGWRDKVEERFHIGICGIVEISE